MTKEIAVVVFQTPIPVPSGLPSNLQASPSNYGLGFIASIIQILFIVSVIFALFSIIISGIAWITSGGDKEKLEGARGRLTWSIIGLVVVFLAYALVNIIGEFFGINLFPR